MDLDTPYEGTSYKTIVLSLSKTKIMLSSTVEVFQTGALTMPRVDELKSLPMNVVVGTHR